MIPQILRRQLLLLRRLLLRRLLLVLLQLLVLLLLLLDLLVTSRVVAPKERTDNDSPIIALAYPKFIFENHAADSVCTTACALPCNTVIYAGLFENTLRECHPDCVV